MPRWAVSDEVFRTRLRGLIERDGRQAVADRYSSAQTAAGRRRLVGRWERGGATSAANRRSVARRGRSATGPAVQLQDSATGRIRYLIDPRAITARRRLQQRETRRRERIGREATTPAEIAAEEAQEQIPVEGMFDDFLFDWEGERDNLLLREAQGEETGFGSALYDDWETWRSGYEQMAG